MISKESLQGFSTDAITGFGIFSICTGLNLQMQKPWVHSRTVIFSAPSTSFSQWDHRSTHPRAHHRLLHPSTHTSSPRRLSDEPGCAWARGAPVGRADAPVSTDGACVGGSSGQSLHTTEGWLWAQFGKKSSGYWGPTWREDQEQGQLLQGQTHPWISLATLEPWALLFRNLHFLHLSKTPDFETTLAYASVFMKTWVTPRVISCDSLSCPYSGTNTTLGMLECTRESKDVPWRGRVPSGLMVCDWGGGVGASRLMTLGDASCVCYKGDEDCFPKTHGKGN